jgi:hypothetical protein
MRRAIVPICALLVVCQSAAFSTDRGRLDASNPLLRSDRFGLPSLDSAENVTSRRDAISYPRFSINLGVAVRLQDNAALNQTYRRIESYFGVSPSRTFSDSHKSFNLGLRLHVSSSISFWWAYYHGGDAGYNQFRVSTVSLSVMYTVGLRRSPLLISIGPGVAQQRLRAGRSYYHQLEGEGVLELIEVNTPQETGIPLTVLIELRDPAKTMAPGFYLCGMYMIASRFSGEDTAGPGTGERVQVESEMSGFWISGGFVFAL